jgi:Protein of unknown function (DUF3592)
MPLTQTTARRRLWIGLVCAALIGALAALLTLGAAIDIVHGPDRGGSIVLALVGIAVIYACATWAIRLEHVLAGHQPVPTASPSRYLRQRSYRQSRRGRRNSPVTLAVMTVFATAFCVGLAVGTVSTHTAGNLSAFVQKHGQRTVATVVSIDNIQHSSRYGNWYTSQTTVALPAPIDGQSSSTVYYPAALSYSAGTPVQVLVDPDRPAYAEYPGSPYTGAGAWIGELVEAVLCGLLGAFLLRETIRGFRRRRRLAAAGVRPAG